MVAVLGATEVSAGRETSPGSQPRGERGAGPGSGVAAGVWVTRAAPWLPGPLLAARRVSVFWSPASGEIPGRWCFWL